MSRRRRVSDQTKMTRALNYGLVPHAHPDELKVLYLLVQQPPPNRKQTGYKWVTGGKTGRYMSIERWAVLLGMSHRQRLHEALHRLWEHGLIDRDDDDFANDGKRRRNLEGGAVPTEWRLSERFIRAAVEYHDEVIDPSGDHLASLVKNGVDPVEHYAKRHGIAKVELPARPKRQPRKKAVEKAEERWFGEADE